MPAIGLESKAEFRDRLSQTPGRWSAFVAFRDCLKNEAGHDPKDAAQMARLEFSGPPGTERSITKLRADIAKAKGRELPPADGTSGPPIPEASSPGEAGGLDAPPILGMSPGEYVDELDGEIWASKRDVNPMEEIMWAAENWMLKAEPEDSPSATAWGYRLMMRQSPQYRAVFFKDVHPKLLPSRQTLEISNALKEDGEQIAILDQLQKKAQELSGEENGVYVATVGDPGPVDENDYVEYDGEDADDEEDEPPPPSPYGDDE